MNWIDDFVPPKIKNLIAGRRGETPENLWRRCSMCDTMIFHRDLQAAQNVCPQCGHHRRIGPKDRFAAIFDGGVYEELPPANVPADPLRFRGEKRYSEELKIACAKTGQAEAVTAARGELEGMPVMIAVQSFEFLGGSLGMAVGETLVATMEAAVAESRPFIAFVSSGGARVAAQTIRAQFPQGYQRAEYLLDHGMVDMVVHRHDLRETLSRLVRLMRSDLPGWAPPFVPSAQPQAAAP